MILFSCHTLSVSQATPTNLIRRDYCISLYGTMTILPDDVIALKGMVVGLMVTHKHIWWDKESLYATYNNTTLIKY